ncbi:MAG: LysR family transcriptional regulator [Eubacteriales bacterium]|nr:LysR family transcriptional regulator [Eubacteriales bacterium]
MTLQQIHYAITISETGSLNKAAEVLYVAQPSLSGAIRDLEEELGIQIFHRSGRGVTLTNDGTEFITHARQLYHQYETILDKYGEQGTLKKKFGVSAQHYTFAVKTFVEMVKQFNMDEYEFAIRETKTREVIEDVSTLRSEIGILYLNDFNRNVLMKLFKSNDLEFHHLIDCSAYVYLWNGHPLAKEKMITLEQLAPYPCLSFEQGGTGSFYFAEELLSTGEYARTIKVNDRATVLNLMKGLNGYTLCSGIVCGDLNGTEYLAVPFKENAKADFTRMEIGYIVRRNQMLSKMGELYIRETKEYLTREARLLEQA